LGLHGAATALARQDHEASRDRCAWRDEACGVVGEREEGEEGARAADDHSEDDSLSSGDDAGSERDSGDIKSDEEDLAITETKHHVLGGSLARDYLPLVLPVTMLTLKGFILLVWPLAPHVTFHVDLLPDTPPRLKITVQVTEYNDDQLRTVLLRAMRKTRQFDEVEEADFANPGHLDEQQVQDMLGGDGDVAAALRKAIHRPPSADAKKAAPPVTYEMKLPKDVDFKAKPSIVDVGSLVLCQAIPSAHARTSVAAAICPSLLRPRSPISSVSTIRSSWVCAAIRRP